MEPNQVVRFKQDSRHGDWTKGQDGWIVRVLALPPQNQFALYIVRFRPDDAEHWESDREVWATDKDIEPWNQLSLF